MRLPSKTAVPLGVYGFSVDLIAFWPPSDDLVHRTIAVQVAAPDSEPFQLSQPRRLFRSTYVACRSHPHWGTG